MTAEEQHRNERHQRIRRTKRLLRPLPRRATLHRYPFLKWFANIARRKPFLWSFRVAQMTPTFYAGSIISFLPLWGFQIPLAFTASLIFKGNLPVACGLQFITNPLTVAPIYFFTYQVGIHLIHFFGFHQAHSKVETYAYGLIVGGIVVGALCGLVLDLVYRFLAYEAHKHHVQFPRVHKKSSSDPDQKADSPNPKK